ncbi:MAG: DUF3048 domain-containing protein [Dethiobacter sp.]|jgi:hypothetical protein|nr:MAG: DUF3048 domain-containing protein [Dethiobacter sp.]
MKKGTRNICFLLFLFLILTILLAGCKANTSPKDPAPEEGIGEEKDNPADQEPQPETPGELSPYTGFPVAEIFNRPYAIIIENLPPTRPQSGLSGAGIVYEFPVEGWITRFLALYISPYEDDIGPVRSARPYIAYLTKEYDGILAHCGYSIHTEAVLKDINAKHIDERYNSLYYKRLKSRNMPHNLYTTLSRLAPGAEKFNYLKGSQPTPVFSFGERKPPEQVVSTISIAFSPQNHVEYHWNSRETYTRYNDGSLFIDANSGEAVEVKNIIIQFIKARAFTSEGHLEITLLGEGKGLLFSGGQVEEIKWQKNSYGEKTRFLDTNGRNILLQPGNTWIHLVPQNGRVEWSLT